MSRYELPGTDFSATVADLQRRLAALERAAQLGRSAIDTGALTIASEGRLQTGVEDADGPLFWLDGSGDGRWKAVTDAARMAVVKRDYGFLNPATDLINDSVTRGVYSATFNVPAGAEMADVVFTPHGRATSNAACHWTLNLRNPNGSTYTEVDKFSMHNFGDPSTMMGGTLRGMVDVRGYGATAFAIYVTGNQDSASGSSTFTRYGHYNIHWLRITG